MSSLSKNYVKVSAENALKYLSNLCPSKLDSRTSSSSPSSLLNQEFQDFSFYINSKWMKQQYGNKSQNKQSDKRMIKGVVFDLDGTLTVPVIDFKKMRDLTGIYSGDILDEIYKLKEKNQQIVKFKAIESVELEALNKLELNPNVLELLSYLHKNLNNFKTLHSSKVFEKDTSGITVHSKDNYDNQMKPIAIVTRNSHTSLEQFLNHLESKLNPENGYSTRDLFPLCISRDYLPYKPNPDSLYMIAEYFDCKTDELLMVGDGSHDMEYAKRANALSCLLLPSQTHQQNVIIDSHLPDFVITDLIHLIDIIHKFHQ